jgi:hypothetical protein
MGKSVVPKLKHFLSALSVVNSQQNLIERS